MSHSGVASLLGLEGSTAVLSHPVVVAVWVDSERTPLGDRNTLGVARGHTLNFSGLFQNIVFWYKQEKKSGVYSFVIVYQEAFFLIFILIRDIEILNILNTNL